MRVGLPGLYLLRPGEKEGGQQEIKKQIISTMARMTRMED